MPTTLLQEDLLKTKIKIAWNRHATHERIVRGSAEGTKSQKEQNARNYQQYA